MIIFVQGAVRLRIACVTPPSILPPCVSMFIAELEALNTMWPPEGYLAED